MDALTFAHYVVLSDASDASPLWELLWSTTSYDKRGTKIEALPALPLAEARQALRALLTSAAVAIYEESGDESRLLTLDQAVAAIEDDSNWIVPAESGRDVWYSLTVTDAGEDTFGRAEEQFGPRRAE